MCVMYGSAYMCMVVGWLYGGMALKSALYVKGLLFVYIACVRTFKELVG